MKGIILHGGHGTRLRPLTYARPKQLLPIANVPMSQYGLESIKEAGINEIAIIIGGNNSQKVREFYGDGSNFGVKITYIEQDEPRGIAHAIGLCEKFVNNEKFLVFLGDNVILRKLSDYASEFEKSSDSAKILLCEVSNPKQFGIADIFEDGSIKKIMEKPKNPPTNLAVIGIYFLTSEIFEIIKNLEPSWRNELEITDALQVLLETKKRISYNIITKYWKDTGTIEDIIDANKTILNNLQKYCNSKIENKSKITGNVIIEKNVKLNDNVSLNGPVIIGENTKIENSTIGPNVSIGKNSKIKNCSIKNSIIMDNVLIEINEQLENSIIGHNSKITKKTEKTLILCEDSKLEL
ncbi:MAG: glucose-1-phosphate thymidylyltransferase [Nitrosopumilus sp.]|nr:glucose-1-phosphate thymidylyltransferase [Nitrosopumilus sp.]